MLAFFAFGPVARAHTPVQEVPPPVAATVVRAYFDAFGRQDAATLGAVTDGEAATDTRKMLQTIQSEAARHKVGVELKVKDLTVSPAAAVAADSESFTPVDVKFNIAVVAKKWFFSRVARHLTGTATFFVGKNVVRGDASAPRIVGIEFALK